jgi:hypothetical protein
MKSNINFSVRTYWFKAAIAFLTCILFLSLQSCEKKKTLAEILIGTWNIESKHTLIYLDETLDYDHTYNYDPNEGAIQFLEKGMGKVYQGGTVVDTYYWSENQLDGNGNLRSEDTFSWQIVEDNLIIGLLNTSSQYAPLYVSFTVNGSYLTLKYLSYEGLNIIAKSIPGDLGEIRREETVLRLSR